MSLSFNVLLREAGIQPQDVRLLRHKDPKALRGRTPYELWRDHPKDFRTFQSIQTASNRSRLKARFWASFVVDFEGSTLFIGLYEIRSRKLLSRDIPRPHRPGVDRAGTCDEYQLRLHPKLKEVAGRLIIDWGRGTRSWIQQASRQDKLVIELRRAFDEPRFPGYLNFIEPLSRLRRMPLSWIEALRSCRGIYLLTCPKTREQYVGSAAGADGFWGRWQAYLDSRHGGNVGLRSRDPSDYRVSVLEVVGTSATEQEILELEARWKRKLQSREMGLNRN